LQKEIANAKKAVSFDQLKEIPNASARMER
jgi:hypothetical protein